MTMISQHFFHAHVRFAASVYHATLAQSLCQKDRYKESPVYQRVQGLRSTEGGFCFRGGWNRCRARGLYAVVVFAVACMAIAATSLSTKEKEKEGARERRIDRWREKERQRSFCSQFDSLRAAESRLAGTADWTTQPRRDAANYPPGTSPYPGRDREREGGIPRGNRLHPIQVTLTRGTQSHRPCPFYLPRTSLHRFALVSLSSGGESARR